MLTWFPIDMTFLPEVILFALALVVLMVGAFGNQPRMAFLVSHLGLLVVLGVLINQYSGLMYAADRLAPDALVRNDGFAAFFKLFMTVGTFFVSVLSERWLLITRNARAEVAVLMLLSLLGMFVMVSANHMLTLYVGLELQSLSLYALTAIARNDKAGAEAGVKYFVLGSLSSGLLLFGISLIYGATGSLLFPEIAYTIGTLDDRLVYAGLVFVIVGVGFKLSAAPFHMWTPDAYQGAPTPVTSFFAIVPKFAAVALAIRLTMDAFLPLINFWQPLLLGLAIASMLIGSLGALLQTNLKRLLAYSTIGHVGFLLIGIATATISAIESVLVYLVIYATTSIGLFAFVLAMKHNHLYVETIDDLKGLAQKHPRMALCLLIMLFSMAGIPPLAGFFAKLNVFIVAIEQGFTAVVIIGVLSSCIAAYYYLRLIGQMYFSQSDRALEPFPVSTQLITAAVTAFLVLFIVFQSAVFVFAQKAATVVFVG